MKTGVLFLLGIAMIVAISWMILPALHFFDVWIVHNPRPAHPLHVLFVVLLGLVMLWVVAPTLSVPFFLTLVAVTGGAASNLLYRIFLGPVPDYIPFPFGAYGNVADLCIFLGVPLFIFLLWRQVLRSRRVQREQESYSEHEQKLAATENLSANKVEPG